MVAKAFVHPQREGKPSRLLFTHLQMNSCFSRCLLESICEKNAQEKAFWLQFRRSPLSWRLCKRSRWSRSANPSWKNSWVSHSSLPEEISGHHAEDIISWEVQLLYRDFDKIWVHIWYHFRLLLPEDDFGTQLQHMTSFHTGYPFPMHINSSMQFNSSKLLLANTMNVNLEVREDQH